MEILHEVGAGQFAPSMPEEIIPHASLLSLNGRNGRSLWNADSTRR